MTYITGHDRSQMLLLPEAVDDYVSLDNPVRFMDAFVGGSLDENTTRTYTDAFPHSHWNAADV